MENTHFSALGGEETDSQTVKMSNVELVAKLSWGPPTTHHPPDHRETEAWMLQYIAGVTH